MLPNFEFPFHSVLSFHTLIDDFEKQLKLYPNDKRTIDFLEKIKKVPELRKGFEDLSKAEDYKELIAEITSVILPKQLTRSEISAISFPWCNTIINPSEAFQELIEEAGGKYDINPEELDEDSFFIAACGIILKNYYGLNIPSLFTPSFNFKNKKGINKHYKITYNLDFLEITPTKQSKKLSDEDIDQLLNCLNKVEVWKEKFPPDSWIVKGFAILKMYDDTIETAFSDLKQLLSGRLISLGMDDKVEKELLKSIFEVQSLDVGISDFDFKENKILSGFYNMFTSSLLLRNKQDERDGIKIDNSVFREYIGNGKIMIVSNISAFLKANPKDEIIQRFHEQGFKSCMLVPMKNENELLAIGEMASKEPNAFNTLNINRINGMYDFLTSRMEQAYKDFNNLKSSVIQREYTRLHPSVAWKFEKEAQKFLMSEGQDYTFKEIVFKEVTALYGQVDIKNSSNTRNENIRKDFDEQVAFLLKVLEYLEDKTQIGYIGQKKFEFQKKVQKLNHRFDAATETEIQQYISNEIHPLISNPAIYKGEDSVVADYIKALDPYTGKYYHARKKFDDSVNLINKRLSAILDERQKDIQKVFPHYFERFKTDGVEHTMYIGQSIAPKFSYDSLYLRNLRLWQLQVTCEMLREHQNIKTKLPIPLEVTSLILVFNKPFSIRFRMDEKRFDVDGAYNAQYEVIKKRIDKSLIKGTNERIVQPETIVIIYSNSEEEKEYRNYIQFLQKKSLLAKKIENLEVGDFQGITGLMALRVGLGKSDAPSYVPYFSYKEFESHPN